MMTSSNGNIFRVTGPLCGEFTAPGEFPTQRPVTRSIDVFFDMRLNKRLCKQPWGWWFETPPSWSLWRQCNENRKKRYEDSTELWGILLQNLYISFVRIRVYFSNTRQFKFGCIYLTNRSKDYGFMETESSSGQQQRQRLPPLFHPSFFRPR